MITANALYVFAAVCSRGCHVIEFTIAMYVLLSMILVEASASEVYMVFTFQTVSLSIV
jgi:hypothetical protein